MSDKKIPVFVGEGDERILVGRAKTETLSDGTRLIDISFDDPDWGSWNIGGFNPLRARGILPPVIPSIYKKG